jgi:uncharacterized protein with HEPN domain
LLAADERTLFAVSYAVQTVGEAAAQVSANTRSRFPKVPWRDVSYQEVRVAILASTIRKDLPRLIFSLKRALESGE